MTEKCESDKTIAFIHKTNNIHSRSQCTEGYVSPEIKFDVALVTNLIEGPVCPCTLDDIFRTRCDKKQGRSTAPKQHVLWEGLCPQCYI
jgi:hypothetical protein